MLDDKTTLASVDRGIEWDIETQLAASLPGLPDDALRDLTTLVAHELHYRVGDSLTVGLTDAQLEEFSDLADHGDDRRCMEWLETHRPDYRATVAVVRADLVAEVVRTVAAVNPDAVRGGRFFAQLLRTSIELAEAHFDSYGIKYTRTGDGLRVMFAGDDDISAIVVWISLTSAADTFILTGVAAGFDFRQGAYAHLCEFAADWNQRTWNPKAIVVTDEDNGRCTVMGEVAVCVGSQTARAQVDVALGCGVGSMFALFAEVRLSPMASESDGQMKSTEAGGSVVEA